MPYVQAVRIINFLNTQTMDTKLIDFTFKELTFLYLVLDEKRRDFENKIEIIEKMEPSQLKYELFEHNVTMLGYCTQLLTKADEASRIVKVRDILQTSN